MRNPLLQLLLLGALTSSGLLSAQVPVTPPHGQPLDIEFQPLALVVANATPLSAIVVFGSAKEFNSFYMTRRVWKEVIADDDGDGVVRLEVPKGIPAESVWVVVDLANGRSAAAAPPGGSARQIPASMRVGRGRGSDMNTLREARKQAYVILVKDLPQTAPGVVPAGAWFMGAGDGNPRDADGALDGSIELRISDAETLGAAPLDVPGGAAGNDFVYVVDPETLEYSAAPLASLREIGQ